MLEDRVVLEDDVARVRLVDRLTELEVVLDCSVLLESDPIDEVFGETATELEVEALEEDADIIGVIFGIITTELDELDAGVYTKGVVDVLFANGIGEPERLDN